MNYKLPKPENMNADQRLAYEHACVEYAFACGKEIEYYSSYSGDWNKVQGGVMWDWVHYRYRKASTKHKVPLECGVILPGDLIKLSDEDIGEVESINKIQVTIRILYLQNIRIKDLNCLGECHYSKDNGKTWLPCWKEVEE